MHVPAPALPKSVQIDHETDAPFGETSTSALGSALHGADNRSFAFVHPVAWT
jgi:hypothetical protein